MKIFVSGIPDLGARTALARLADGHEVTFSSCDPVADSARRALAEADIALGVFPADLIDSARRLRWMQFLAVGIDAYRSAPWTVLRTNVICTNLRGVFAEAMAQSVLAGVLVCQRGIDQAIRLQQARTWQKDQLHARARVLRGAHVLLLGNGTVATRIRELLAMFGCSFTTFARTTGDIHTGAELDEALPVADIVCAALPDTAETRMLLDARRIAFLKRETLLINVGRGTLLDEAALVHALHSSALRGAVLDVTQREPLPPEDPLWNCPRLILTQHSAAGSHEELILAIEFFVENLARYTKGRDLVNVVDWIKGY